MDIIAEIEKAIGQTGFSEFGYVELDRLKYYPEVRKICEGNTCRNYGSS